MRASALAVLAAALLVPLGARASDPPTPSSSGKRYQLEIGPSFGFIKHVAANGNDPIDYRSTFSTTGLLVRATPAAWLKLSFRFHRSYHDVDVGPGSLGTHASSLSVAPMKVDALYGFVHPTWNPLDRLHVWGTFGISWGRIDMPAVQLEAADGPVIRARSGVFLEAPIGAGISFDVIPSWLTLSYDVMYGPAFSQSGDLFSTDIYVNRSGTSATAQGMPELSGSYYHLFALALAL